MVYYVALPFIPIEGGLAPGEAVECPSDAAAIRRAEAMAFNNTNAGAVALSRSGDPNIGEFDDAVILKTFGQGAGGFRGNTDGMIYRKGELSPAAVDRGWPYQVALSEDRVTGGSYNVVHDFCRDLSLCSRGHSVQKDGVRYVVFCFSDPEHAELFRVRFGGEAFDPRDRGREATGISGGNPKIGGGRTRLTPQ